MDNKEDQKKGLFKYNEKRKQPVLAKGETPQAGMISNSLTRAISYDKDPDLFDRIEVKERDALIKSDEKYSLKRNYKPIELDSEEFRAIFALSFGITQEVGKEEIKNAIARANENRGPNITRYVDIHLFTKLIYDRTDKVQKANFIRTLWRLSNKIQVLMLGDNPKEVSPVLSTLIRINFEDIFFKKIDGTKISASDFEDFLMNAPDEEIAESIEGINVGFGMLFFLNLDIQWGYLRIEAFKALRENRTQLFQILLCTINLNYYRCVSAADKAETNIRKELKNGTITKEEFDEEVEKARRAALTYQINVSSIIAKVNRNYSGKKQRRRAFWLDLEKAAKSLESINLITGYKRKKGAKGQDKIEFYLNPNYKSGGTTEDNTQKLLKNAKTGERTLCF